MYIFAQCLILVSWRVLLLFLFLNNNPPPKNKTTKCFIIIFKWMHFICIRYTTITAMIYYTLSVWLKSWPFVFCVKPVVKNWGVYFYCALKFDKQIKNSIFSVLAKDF